jgi:hypothetical protein
MSIDQVRAEIQRFADDVAKMDNIDLPEKCALFLDLSSFADRVKELNSAVGELVKEVKENRLPNAFKEANATSITAYGYRFTVSTSLRAGIIPERKDDAYNWLRENGLEDLIQETVNASTLAATAKTLLEDGVDMPDDLFRTHYFENTSKTKVK